MAQRKCPPAGSSFQQMSSVKRVSRASWWAVLIPVVCSNAPASVLAGDIEPSHKTQVDCPIPSWLYPSPSPSHPINEPRPEERVRLAGSSQALTRAQLSNLYSAPDWHPDSHAPLPDIVAHGRRPSIYACGYCHTPTGQGRPENAQLAGLPAAYISDQLTKFASGARAGAWCGAYTPTDFMIQSAKNLTATDIASASEYFARQVARSRVHVVETDRVPRSRVIGLVYAVVQGAGEEPLGMRLMEFSSDSQRHELRDDRMRYIAYAPRGSVARGRRIASQGIQGAGNACEACHGPLLRGVGSVPALAGRSPTYLLRALFAFRTGKRSGGTANLMQLIAAELDTASMIDVVAYAASLPVSDSGLPLEQNRVD